MSIPVLADNLDVVDVNVTDLVEQPSQNPLHQSLKSHRSILQSERHVLEPKSSQKTRERSLILRIHGLGHGNLMITAR